MIVRVLCDNAIYKQHAYYSAVGQGYGVSRYIILDSTCDSRQGEIHHVPSNVKREEGSVVIS